MKAQRDAPRAETGTWIPTLEYRHLLLNNDLKSQGIGSAVIHAQNNTILVILNLRKMLKNSVAMEKLMLQRTPIRNLCVYGSLRQ